MTNFASYAIGATTFLAFATLTYLLKVKRIDSNNTLFVGCLIVVLDIVAVLGLLPSEANDKIVIGLVSIGSGIVGFLSRGIVDAARDTSAPPLNVRSPEGLGGTTPPK